MNRFLGFIILKIDIITLEVLLSWIWSYVSLYFLI